MAVSLSFVQGRGYLPHNERKFSRSNVDPDRTVNNLTIRGYDSVEAAYQDLFAASVEAHNAKQKREERKKTVEGYLEDIQKKQNLKNGEKPFYETIVMIGDKDTTGIVDHPVEAEKAARTLWNYAIHWEQRNPNLKLIEITLHMDEATPHLHIDYIPIAEGYKNGMPRRNSISKALEQQGIENKGQQGANAVIAWQERERAYISTLARGNGLEIEKKGITRPRLTVQEYKRERDRITAAGRTEKPLNLKKNIIGRYTISKTEQERMRSGFERSLQATAAAELEQAALEEEKQRVAEAAEAAERERQIAKELQRQAAAALASVGALQEQLEEKEAEIERYRNDYMKGYNYGLKKGEKELESAKVQINNLKRKLDISEKNLKEANDKISNLRWDVDQLNKKIAEQDRQLHPEKYRAKPRDRGMSR